MARLFTISFTYNEEHFTSMVTVKTTPYYMEYTLNNLDADLLLQLPGNKIISVTPRQFLFPGAEPQHSTGLMNAILNAVAAHLLTINFRQQTDGDT